MDRITIQKDVGAFIKKYKYIILVLIIGLILMMIPSIETPKDETVVISHESSNILSVEEQLAQILSHVKGAGKVQVMLRISIGEETFYQTDDNYSSSDGGSTEKRDTVTVTDADRNQTGLIRQVNPPVYAGAIIVCQGADSPTVRYAIIEAVSKFTGLGSDKISILKMK